MTRGARLAAFVIAGILSAQTPPATRRVILIDLDGVPREIFKAAYLDRRLPNFERILGRAGEKPEAALWFDNATTVFPSITLTGHASMFTGTYPDRHAIPGNQWFNRSTGQLVDYMSVEGIACVYGVAFVGGNGCRGGRANHDLEAPTIYQAAGDAGKTTVVVYSEYWAGATQSILPSPVEALTFLSNHSFDWEAYDTRMMDHALAALEAGLPDLLTVYFAGTDGVAHELGTAGQSIYLQNSTDQQIGRLLGRLEALDADWHRTTLFVITSDHGRTDLVFHPEDPLIEGQIAAALNRIGYDATRMSLANNEGMAHLYLRARSGDLPWPQPPSFQDTCEAAQTLFRDPALRDVLESILVRQNREYWTYGETEAGLPEMTPVPQGSLIQRLNSPRSGDILLLLKAGHYFGNTGKGSQHGSIHELDLAIPLILAQGGIAPGRSREPVSIVQIAKTIADFLGVPMAGTEASLIHDVLTKPPDPQPNGQPAPRPGFVPPPTPAPINHARAG